METVLVSIGLMAALMGSMAIGVIFSGRSLKGSCGGVGGRDCLCEEQNDPKACSWKPDQQALKKETASPAGDGVMVYE